MQNLKKPYVQVKRSSLSSYGGSQMWSSKKSVRLCGCGPVAVFDTILYLTGRQKEAIPEEEYNRELLALCRRYFPVLLPFGVNGFHLAVGMNLLLRRHGLPYRAYWAVSGRKFWDRISSLLEQDIPAVFSIGPNFPAVWSKHTLPLYRRQEDGGYRQSASAIAHYVTATGIDEEWLRISSWGEEYYIRRREYDEYVKKHSAALVSNILMLRKTR